MPGTDPNRPAADGRRRIAVRLLFSGSILALLLLVVPWDQVTTAASRLTLLLYGLALAAYLGGHAVGVLKWRMVVGASHGTGRLPVGDAAGCYSAGLFANLFLPSVVGGDVVRAALAARALGRPEAVVLGSIADRVIDVAGLALLIAAGVAVAGMERTGGVGGEAVLLLALLLAAGAGSLFVVLRRPLRRWPRRFRRHIGRALAALRRLGRRPGVAGLALLLSLAMQSLFILISARLGTAVGADAPLWAWFVVWPLAKAAGMLPITLGGLGVRDAALTTLLVPFGVPAAFGLVASLAWNAVVVGGAAVAGLVALPLRPARRVRGRARGEMVGGRETYPTA